MTDSERKRIFGLSRQLGMNSDVLHLLIHGVTGCDSIKELDKAQTYEVIKELNVRMEQQNIKPKRSSKPPAPAVAGMMSNQQQSKVKAQICELMRLDGVTYTSDEFYRRLSGAIRKILGNNMASREKPFYGISMQEGIKLIDTLKLYIRSAERKAIKEGRILS